MENSDAPYIIYRRAWPPAPRGPPWLWPACCLPGRCINPHLQQKLQKAKEFRALHMTPLVNIAFTTVAYWPACGVAASPAIVGDCPIPTIMQLNATELILPAITKAERRAMYERISAQRVARQWLLFAERVIARGENPVKLSVSASDDAIAEFEPGGLMSEFTYSRASRDRIATSALGEAVSRLRRGEFPTVTAFFSTVSLSKELP
jgi:hypothetical protein